MNLTLSIITIVVSSIIIYFAGERFAKSSSAVGDHLKLPRSVKGATFDAVSSSLPELLVALYSVVFFKQFEVGVGTIAGSALFNLLIIPGLAVFVAPVVFKVHKKVVSRDALFYLMAVFVLVVILIYFKWWGTSIALILLFMYLWYVSDIFRDSVKYRNEVECNIKCKLNLSKEIVIGLILLGVIGITTFFLTEASINMSHILGLSPIIIAFTITAAATSIPDLVISLVNARNGDCDDAAANVFGSNVFDIFVGLGFPLLLYSIIKGPVLISFTNLEIILGLLGSTILVFYFLAEDHTLSKKNAVFLLLMYLIFIVYIILLSMKVF